MAELYGPLRSQVPDPEPYAQFIARYGEPALELGCGTGDPILALRERGLDVDGVDSSAHMLAKCRAAAEARGIDVALFEQAMETLDLPRRYRTIYLAGPTFNLLTDDRAARDALTRIGAHLDPAGAALVPLFIPSPTPPDQLGVAREHVTDDGRVQRVTPVSETRDNRKRLQTTVLRYESTLDGVTETVERPWLLHWHTQAGFTKLAEAAGLTVDAVLAPSGGSARPNDDAFVFVLRSASPPERRERDHRRDRHRDAETFGSSGPARRCPEARQ